MRSEHREACELDVPALRWVRAALATFVAFASTVDGARGASPEPPGASVCAACHGEAGRSVAPTFPNLAGQQPEYLHKQLTDFAKGRRMNEVRAMWSRIL